MQPDQENARQKKAPWPAQQRRHPAQGSEEVGREGGGGGEERRLHVLYFLSRDGKAEQPHLIRVRRRRRRRDGVLRLRDVKRWLSELRGAGMPDAFAWSCKRRYGRGYVWEDLGDDDIISPVSGDEYVLKGSLITHAAAGAATGTEPTPSSSSSSLSSPPTAAACAAVGCPSPLSDPKSPRPPGLPPTENPDLDDDASPTPLPRLDDDEEGGEEEVDEASTQTAGSRGVAAVFRADLHQAGAAAGPPPPPVPGSGSGEIVEEAESRGDAEEKKDSHAQCNNAGGGGGGRASQVFRTLLRCGADAVHTNDSALLPFKPRRAGELGGSNGNSRGGGGGGVQPWGRHQPREPTEEGEARRSRGAGRSRSRNGAGGAAAERRKKTASVEGNRPAAEPHCAQCGRAFRPERLHSHMKSCRALKGQRKSMGSGKLPQKPGSQRAVLSEEAASLFLLTH